MVKKQVVKKKIVRTFRGLTVVEAEADIILVPNKADLACAVRGDAGNCVFAQTCKRCFESAEVEIFKTCAYIDLPDEKGARYLKRFKIPPITNAQIERYDVTGELNTGGYLLKAPTSGTTLDSQAERHRNMAKVARVARISGERVTRGSKRPTRAGERVRQTLASKKAAGIRNGSGLVGFRRNQTLKIK